MKKTVARITTTAIVAVALATCAVPAMAAAEDCNDGTNDLCAEEEFDGASAVTATKKASVKPRIKVKGKTMVIKLKENITTGYAWTCKAKGQAVKLDKKHSGYIDPKTAGDVCGAPGTHKYTFNTKKAGKTSTIKMTYSRSWDTSDKTVVTVKVKTSKKGKISVVSTTVK